MYESIFIVYHDRQKFHWMYFTELWILVMEKTEKVMENHGIFYNLKSTNPVEGE